MRRGLLFIIIIALGAIVLPPVKELDAPNESRQEWYYPYLNYRALVNVSEPNATDRTNVPINIFIDFVPNANIYSIRVSGFSGEYVPFQLWNITFISEDTIDSATITLLDSISRNTNKSYWVYYDTYNPGAAMVYDRIVAGPSPKGYIFTPTQYSSGTYKQLETSRFYGNKIYSLIKNTLEYGPGGTGLHFSPVKSKEGEIATIVGAPLTQSIVDGKVFVDYEIESAIKGKNGTVGFGYLSYRIFEHSIIVNETVKLTRTESETEYKIAGIRLGIAMDEIVYYADDTYYIFPAPSTINVSSFQFAALYDLDTNFGIAIIPISTWAGLSLVNNGFSISAGSQNEFYCKVSISGNTGDSFGISYVLYMWEGHGPDKYADALAYSINIKQPLIVAIDHVENKYYSVRVVVKSSDGLNMNNVNVSVVRMNDSVIVASGYTDTSGVVLLTSVPAIEDVNYRLVARYDSSGTIIENNTITFSLTQNREFTVTLNAVYVRVSVVDNALSIPLMNANVSFTKSGSTYWALTDHRGWGILYLPPDDSTNYTVSVVWNGSQRNINGSSTLSVSITTTSNILLVSNVVNPPPVAIFDVISYDGYVTWRDNVSISLWFHAGPLDINTNTIKLDIYNETNALVKNYTSIQSNNGIVTLSFNTTELVRAGRYTLVWNATLNQALFQGPGVLVLQLVINKESTNAIISAPQEVYFNETYSMRIYYLDSDNNIISNANVTVKIWGETIMCYYFPGGYYQYTKSNVQVTPGIYTAYIYFSSENYESIIKSFTVIVKARPLLVETTVETLSIEFRQNKTMNLVLLDKLTGLRSNESPVIVVYNESDFAFVKLLTPIFISENMSWSALIDTTDLPPGRYIISIEGLSVYMKAEEIFLTMNVLPIAAELKGPSTIYVSVEDVISGQKEFVLVYEYVDSRSGIPLSGANLSVTINDKTYQLVETSPGRYEIKLSTRDVSIGDHVLIIRAEKENYSTVILVAQLKIDFVGGTFYLGMTPVPAIWIILLTIGISSIAGISAFKVVMYYRIPWEARYIYKIIKKLEKGEIPTIVSPERDELLLFELNKDILSFKSTIAKTMSKIKTKSEGGEKDAS